VNFLTKLFSKKSKPKFVFMRKIALFTPAEENGAAIIAAVGGGRMPKNGDGMTINLMRSMGAGHGVCFDSKSDVVGLSPVGSAQIVHDNNGGEWLESQYPSETNSAQFPQNWSVLNKEASCQ
jgi:hypothetical protein